MAIDDSYLGDGVYASFDGSMIWLDLRGQDNTTKIALEPAVFNNLIQFQKSVANATRAMSRSESEAVYAGTRTDSCTDIVVTKNGTPLDPAPSQELFNHSPDGFNWGFGGSGSAQLALALLIDAEVEQPLQLYQKFKFEVVAGWGDRWEITAERIKKWAEGLLDN